MDRADITCANSASPVLFNGKPMFVSNGLGIPAPDVWTILRPIGIDTQDGWEAVTSWPTAEQCEQYAAQEAVALPAGCVLVDPVVLGRVLGSRPLAPEDRYHAGKGRIVGVDRSDTRPGRMVRVLEYVGPSWWVRESLGRRGVQGQLSIGDGKTIRELWVQVTPPVYPNDATRLAGGVAVALGLLRAGGVTDAGDVVDLLERLLIGEDVTT